MTPTDATPSLPDGSELTRVEMQRQLEKLTRINYALMQRVERSMDQQANAYSLFQTAIGLESLVRIRTEELNQALHRLALANSELVVARDAAERANRFKTRFFTAVGHDLLQPLHAARLTLSAMMDGPMEAQQLHLSSQIDNALSTIEELLRTILDLSKLEAGEKPPTIQPIDIEELFSGITQDLAPIARAKGLKLQYRRTSYLVHSDVLMLRRIIQNLVANAVHYSREGRVLLAGRRRGDMFRIEVWDTGPGISATEQKRIFDEFQRGAASETSRVAGFGLGLSIVQRMSEALGHPLALCSRENLGSCFSVSVPICGLRSTATPPLTRQAPIIGPPAQRVLVIENEPAVVEAMKSLLTRWGCEVRTVVDLPELERLKNDEPGFLPDVILADYHLNSGITGVELVSRLRAMLGVDVPAIVISADHSLSAASLSPHGAFEILRKPVKPAELRALIQHVLN